MFFFRKKDNTTLEQEKNNNTIDDIIKKHITELIASNLSDFSNFLKQQDYEQN